MNRKTSAAVYREIQEKGLLGRLQMEVYGALFYHGPLTQNELHQEFFANTQPRNVQPRVSELEAMGVVEAVGERPCRITGRVCIAWDVTDTLPREPQVKQKPLKDIVVDLVTRIQALEARIQMLETSTPKQTDLFNMRGH